MTSLDYFCVRLYITSRPSLYASKLDHVKAYLCGMKAIRWLRFGLLRFEILYYHTERHPLNVQVLYALRTALIRPTTYWIIWLILTVYLSISRSFKWRYRPINMFEVNIGYTKTPCRHYFCLVGCRLLATTPSSVKGWAAHHSQHSLKKLKNWVSEIVCVLSEAVLIH